MLKLLSRLAARQKVSVAELIRRAIEKSYSTAQSSDKKEAFARLSKQDSLAVEDWSKMKKELLGRYE